MSVRTVARLYVFSTWRRLSLLDFHEDNDEIGFELTDAPVRMRDRLHDNDVVVTL
jgi:hypothetical protein